MQPTRELYLDQKLKRELERRSKTKADALLNFMKTAYVLKEDVIKYFLQNWEGDIVFNRLKEDEIAKEILKQTLKGKEVAEQKRIMELNGIDTFMDLRKAGIFI